MNEFITEFLSNHRDLALEIALGIVSHGHGEHDLRDTFVEKLFTSSLPVLEVFDILPEAREFVKCVVEQVKPHDLYNAVVQAAWFDEDRPNGLSDYEAQILAELTGTVIILGDINTPPVAQPPTAPRRDPEDWYCPTCKKRLPVTSDALCAVCGDALSPF